MYPKTNLSNRLHGNAGEETACNFLVEKGFTIIARNFRYGRYGELDIIAVRDLLVVFVEVKARSGNAFGGGEYAISARKKKTLRTVARHFLIQYPRYDKTEITCRFDLITINEGTVQWIQDIVR